jgi:uncharacterized lipoprotein YmbA
MSVGIYMALLVLAAFGAACGSSPNATFYALSATQGQALTPANRVVVRVRRPGIAGYLDRPEIVRRIVDSRLGIASTDRWGSPIDTMIEHVLAEDLEQRLPGSNVYSDDGAITADAAVTVEVDVRTFEVGDAGEVRLVAEVAVAKGPTPPVLLNSVQLSAKQNGVATSAQVTTMSDLLGRLADRIASMIRNG